MITRPKTPNSPLGDGIGPVIAILIPSVIISIGLTMFSESSIDSANDIGTPSGLIFAGVALGIAYFIVSEVGQAENNRSYLANPITDVFALIGSAFVAVRATQLDESLIAGLASTVYTIHVLQVIYKQGLKLSK
tara:strand:+ start:1585 stop:1986 length:402 start_codon:yes stop_codon:yes gene_type:complete